MLDDVVVRELLHRKDLSRRDKVLVLIAAGGSKGVSAREVGCRAAAAGLRAVRKWDISSTVRRAGGAVFSGSGWELTEAGRVRVEQVAGPLGGPARKAAVDLRVVASAISVPHVAVFVGEAIGCLEARLLRAAIVLSWIGAVSLLYDHVVKVALPAFNAEALRRDVKWRPAATADDIARMKEFDFLSVLEAISMIGKNVKQELQQCLSLRNACGHPNSLGVGEAKVAAHIESLILNVFAKF